MASVTEYLLQLQKLTQTNLDILQTLTDAFYTKQNHLNTNIDDSEGSSKYSRADMTFKVVLS